MKFQKHQHDDDNAVLARCYANKLKYNCSYLKEVEDRIDAVCELAHGDEQIPWWIIYLD